MSILLYCITAVVLILSFINLLRMTMFLVGSDLYELFFHIKSKRRKQATPTFSVVIPVFNEERSILHCVNSVFANRYPKSKLQVIVVDDGSTDNTISLLNKYKSKHPFYNLIIISQPNAGKAHALNNGMRNFATGEFAMCLDSDSYLDPHAISKAVNYFQNEKVMAVAANVKITESHGFLNLIQQFEYIVSYRMKRAQTFFNIEYIIGGVGATFRKSFLEKIDYYDTNTVTEDIDLTMKILQYGNKNVRVVYGADVIAYTQSVLSISDLIRQRFRWKWGRFQTFLKNKSLFFPKEKIHTKGLTWFYLPYALFSEITFLFEPIMITFILFVTIFYHDFLTLISAGGVLLFYMMMNIISENTISLKERFILLLMAPTMYFLFYILSFVEYVALLKSVIQLHTLPKSVLENRSSWQPVKRHNFISLSPAFEEISEG